MDSTAFFLIGMLVLAAGSAQVVGFADWGWNWDGLITLFGWIALLKGLAILAIPGYMEKFVGMIVKKGEYLVSVWIALVIGICLLYVGYILH